MNADYFSDQASEYARFRPGYPPALLDWVATLTNDHELAWDCGCGNGQAAVPLARHYARVVATDISARQIAQAPLHEHIDYRVATAEYSGLPAACCDVVTVAQALHWFDFDRFNTEVRRVLKPGGVLAAWTYQMPRAETAIDEVIAEYHGRVLAPWWPPERRWVDAGYRNIPFPYDEIPAPAFEIHLLWTLEDLLAYLRTWTATRRLAQTECRDPILPLAEALRPLWGEKPRSIVWPIAMRAGRV